MNCVGVKILAQGRRLDAPQGACDKVTRSEEQEHSDEQVAEHLVVCSAMAPPDTLVLVALVVGCPAVTLSPLPAPPKLALQVHTQAHNNKPKKCTIAAQ